MLFHATIRHALGGCALIALAAPAASAQTQAADQVDEREKEKETRLDDILVVGRSEGYQTGETNTATKLPLTLRETPQSVTVITRQRIEDFNLITIADVLEQTPGITLQSYDSNRTRFQSRGFTITNFQLDGVPSNFNVGASGNSVMPDTSTLERIEVVRGAAGLVTGTGDPSATINLVRKRPTRDLHANVSLNYGSWDYVRAEADVGGPLVASGKIRARAVAAYTTRGSYIDFQNDTSPSLYGVVEADLTNTTRIRGGVDYLRTDSQGGSWSAVPLFFSDGTRTDLPRSYSAAAYWNRWERDNTNAFGTVEQEIGRWVARVAYNHRWTDTESLLLAGSNSTFFPNRQTGLGLNVVNTYGKSHTEEDSLDGYATGPLRLFGRDHEIVLGANHYDRTLANRATTLTAAYGLPTFRVGTTSYITFPSIYSWNGFVPRPATSDRGFNSSVDETKQTSAYGAVRLNPTDWLKIIAGGRWTDVDTVTDTYNTTTSPGTLTRTVRVGDNKFSPYAGIIVDLSTAISAFASYAQVFTVQTQRNVDNEQLAPLTGTNYEFGLKGEFFDKRLYVSAGGFHMKQDNVAQLIAGAPPLPDGSTPYQAVSGVTTWGGEFEVAGSITPAWRIAGGYTYARSESADGTRFSPDTPLHQAKLNTTYRIGPVTLGGGALWQSRIYRAMPIPTGAFLANGQPVTATGNVSQGSYFLLDLLARYDLSSNVSIGVNATNILDKTYFRNVGFFNSGWYGQPRRVLGNLRWRF
ncbi:TonB-dependent siderophore receptor [Sphingomonas sp. PsM26]|nr:TonB-dependent siderophore receptor [Sphingomonas sp. PsM26]